MEFAATRSYTRRVNQLSVINLSNQDIDLQFLHIFPYRREDLRIVRFVDERARFLEQVVDDFTGDARDLFYITFYI